MFAELQASPGSHYSMLLLAIDTSGKNGSIALARAGEKTNDEVDVEIVEIAPLAGGTFSAELVPQIAALLTSRGFTKYDIGAFVVASGPGSFTGLRIGLAAVKGLAEVLGKPIASVSLLEACVFSSGTQGKVMAALDSGRGEVYVGEYEVPLKEGKGPREHILSIDEFLTTAEGWAVATPDVTLAEAGRAAGLSVTTVAPISAATVARLGWSKLQRGLTVTPEQLEANYIRRTDAENSRSRP